MVRVAGFLSILGAFFSNLCLAIYPRKGTETICLPVLIRHGPPLQFIPRKGTETNERRGIGGTAPIAIYTP